MNMYRSLRVLPAQLLLLSGLLAGVALAESPDEAAVRELEGGVAMVLAKQGFEAYAQCFHADYSNWSGGGPPLDRARFLAGVKAWYEGGGKPVAVQMQPITIEVFGDVALSRYHLREDFNDGSSVVGRFVSLAKRENGRWLLFRTHFDTVYQGPSDKAPKP